MSGSKQLLLQVCLLIGLTAGALCLKNTVDPTIAERPPPPPPPQWNNNVHQHQHAHNGPWKNNNNRQQPPARTSALPPYAVKMEPMVHYSQQDPLYAANQHHHHRNNNNNNNNNISAKIDWDAGGGGGGWGAAPSGVGVATDYGVPDTYGAPPPSSYLQPDYYGAKEPEPIIEIIIKESNESLPAPPPPPPQPVRPAKEPVQVFYVKYKKNPNAYGDKDDIIYEKPVPAITPLAGGAETTAAAAAVGDVHGGDAAAYATAAHATEPSPVYGYATAGPPPAPSTTYRTIIKPDSEVYHGTGLKVTFGKSEASWGVDGELNEAQKRDSVSDASSSSSSSSSSSVADLHVNVVRKNADQEFKRSFVQPSPVANDYQRHVEGFGGAPHAAGGQSPQFNAGPKPTAQEPRKPGQQAQSFFREDGPRPTFQGQIPILRPQQNHFETVVEQRPLEFKDNARNQQSHPQFNNNQPNYQHLNNQPNVQQFNNQPNHQQFTNQQNHQQFTNQQNHQQFTNQQTHQQLNNQHTHQQLNNQQNHQQLNNHQNLQQLNKQQTHQQFINQPNPQQLNNQQNHQHFTNHQSHQQLVSQPSHQQIVSQPSHQQPNNQQSHQKLINQQSHQQFVNQQRPQDFQTGPPPRNTAGFQERPAAPIKAHNERPLITQPFENLSLQNIPFETRAPQDRPFDSRPFESRPVPERSLENRPVFDRPFENRPNQHRPFDNRHNQPTVNYRPNKPPTPQNIPLNPNPSFVPSDKRPTVPPPQLPSNYNTQPLGTKHSVDLAFSPQQQQQQHQQFQKQQFQQQQFQQQYRPADARPPPNGNGPAASFVQQPIKQQQQQFVTESKPSQIPQLQITQSNGFKLEPERPAQSGQFFETYNHNRYSPSTQTEQTFHFDHSPWQVSSQPQGSSFRYQPPQEYRDYSTTSTVRSSAPELVTSARPAQYKTTEKPTSAQYRERTTAPSTTTTTTTTRTTTSTAATYLRAGPVAEAAKGGNGTGNAVDFKTFASLPDEVPDELREQLLSSGILSNADIQILDYDKVGDIPIENLPPEALENLYGQGSAPVPSIALPPQGKPVNPPPSPGKPSGVQMKVVRYDPATEEGRRVEDAYVDRPRAQTLPPVVLNDTGYNRFLPLNIDGAQFPIPDSPLLRNKAIGSVVILSPVGYDVSADDQSRPSRNAAAVKVKGVHFVVGDIVKNLVRDPSRRNFETWLEKERDTPAEEQSVVLLVTKPNGKTNGKEIYMYDVTHNQVNKLSGELSATFVDVAESNSKSNDLDNLSSEEEVDVVVSGNSTDDNTPVASSYSKTDDFSSSIVATANN